jgi:hypothetical protein
MLTSPDIKNSKIRLPIMLGASFFLLGAKNLQKATSFC